MLGSEIGMLESLCLFEHVLPEQARIQAGGRDGADVVKAPGPDILGEPDRMGGAVHVDLDLAFRIGHEIVDGGQVEDMMDLPFELATLRRPNTQHGPGQITGDGNDPLAAVAPLLALPLEFLA